MQKIWTVPIIVFLALVLVACTGTIAPLTMPTTPAPEPVHEAVFKTPEEAIAHYFEGLSQADIDRALQACAIDEMAENFRFDLASQRLRYFQPLESLAPTDHAFLVDVNRAQLSARILSRVKISVFSLLSGEDVNDGVGFAVDAEWADQFMADVDPARLAQLALEQVALPDGALMTSERYQENAAALAAVYGADESSERVALFSFEGQDYVLGFTLLRYGEQWKISDPVSPLAGTSLSGAPQRTSVAEFESMFNRD